MSFLLIFFAYLNKFHPSFKVNFCKSMETYNLCPKSFYIPKNLISISVAPAGASIFINGEKLGLAPQDIVVKNLPLKIDLRKDGYKPVTHVLSDIPEDNAFNVQMVKTPTGFLRVKAVGVQIFVDGIEVKSGQKVSVPASKKIVVKISNPFNGQSKQKTFVVKPGQYKAILMSLP